MRKKVFGRKLSRNTNTRKALFRSIISAFVANGQIETTKAKAKAVQPEIDKLMTLVAKNDLAARRLALKRLGNDKVTVDKLFGELKELTTKRKSGFTRIINLPDRKGDKAPMVKMEFVK
jgi:large subunit ribosomal protein L17